MKREKLKKSLSSIGISEHTINSILCGRRRPSYEKILELNEKHKIPFTAWRDIKSYLQENNTKQNGTTTRTI